MHPYLEKIYETGYMIDKDGNSVVFSNHITIEEGLFIQEVIRKINPSVSLEVGLAMGISSMFICETLKELNAKKHIVIVS